MNCDTGKKSYQAQKQLKFDLGKDKKKYFKIEINK